MSRIRHTSGRKRDRRLRLESLEPRRLLAADIIVTEVMYNVDGPDEGFEYVELYNRGDAFQNLAGWKLQDKGATLHTIVDHVLHPGQYVLIASDVDNFTGFNVIGENNSPSDWAAGGLSNSGDRVKIINPSNVEIANLNYDDSGDWPTRPDGNGSSLQIVDLLADANDLYDADNWIASRELGGTPGVAGSVNVPTVVINEILANSDDGIGELDQIELHNTGESAAYIANWYLTDRTDFDFAEMYQISPADHRVSIPAGGYVVFDESDFNAGGARSFGLSSNGGDTLSLVSAGTSTIMFVDSIEIPATETSVSFSRIPNGSGEFFPAAEQTFGDPNDGHVVSDVVISEINYNPNPLLIPNTNIVQNELEYIELHNQSDQPVVLSDWQLRRDVDFTFPAGSMLGPNERLLVLRFDPALGANAAKTAAFETAYGITLDLVPNTVVENEVKAVGSLLLGGLNNRAATIELRETFLINAGTIDEELVYYLRDAVSYEDRGAWSGRADETGSSLVRLGSELFGNDPANWIPSVEFGGSPGSAGLGDHSFGVVVNEVLAHTDLPLYDTVELHNVTDAEIDISGWWLSDSNNDFFKFEIPAGTTIPAGSYEVFDELDFNPSFGVDPSHFSFSGANGDDVWLTAVDTGSGDFADHRFADHVEFGASFVGESFARFPNGTGQLFPSNNRTLGWFNDGPELESVVITEIVYDSGSTADVDELEFVEIFNKSVNWVNLNPNRAPGSTLGGGWHLDGFDFDFAVNTWLEPGEVAVIVAFDPADTVAAGAFRTAYGVDPGVTLLGPAMGRLNNAGEPVRLLKEDDQPLGWTPPVDWTGPIPFLPLVVRDEVDYLSTAPWPTDPAGDRLSGTELSLTRRAPGAFGSFPVSWTAETPTPGTVTTEVAGRHVFYNESVLDGNGPSANAADDAAIATDKMALLPGEQATSANVTNYHRGINGVMVDLFVSGDGLTAANFEFRVGNNDDPTSWTAPAATPTITARAGAGVDYSTRVSLVWDDLDIANEWLEVTVKGGGGDAPVTGLFEDDVFYFGNAIGDTENDSSAILVNSADVIGVRDNPRSSANPAGVANPFDFNRDRIVDAADLIIARNGASSPLSAVRFITPAPPAAAPAPMGEAAPLRVETAAVDLFLAGSREPASAETAPAPADISYAETRLPDDVLTSFASTRTAKRALAKETGEVAEAVDSLMADSLLPALP